MIENFPGEEELNLNIPPEAKNIVEVNSARWLNSLLTRDPKTVAELYAEDATFLPTVSGEFKKGRKGAEEYFTHFLQKNPEGEIEEEAIQVVSPTVYLQSGIYNFELGQEAREKVAARFSFMWRQNEKGEWEIIHHHSSMRPEIK